MEYYYSDKVLEWIGRRKLDQLTSEYEVRLLKEDEIILSELYNNNITTLQAQQNFKMKSTYVLNKIDDKIKKETHGISNIDSLISFYFMNNMYCFEDVLTHNTLRLLVIDNHLIYLS